MSDVIGLIDRQVAAYRARNLDAFLAFYAEDVTIKDFDGNVLMQGRDGMRSMYGPLFRDSPDLAVELARRSMVGDFVVDEENISGFNLEGFPPAFSAVVVYRVQDGLIRDAMFLS
jgi:uncharacterized protein (TIGR02246 family)